MSTDPRRWVPIEMAVESGEAKQAEATDPYDATAVFLHTPGYDGLAAMGRAFVEEFALLGWSRERVERMFRMPRYVAAHAVYLKRGPAFVTELIDDVLGPSRSRDQAEAN